MDKDEWVNPAMGLPPGLSLVQFIIVLATTALLGKQAATLQIRPKPCMTPLGETGTCMFVWECIKMEGTHLDTCADGFLFGSCCSQNDKTNTVPVSEEKPGFMPTPFSSHSPYWNYSTNNRPLTTMPTVATSSTDAVYDGGGTYEFGALIPPSTEVGPPSTKTPIIYTIASSTTKTPTKRPPFPTIRTKPPLTLPVRTTTTRRPVIPVRTTTRRPVTPARHPLTTRPSAWYPLPPFSTSSVWYFSTPEPNINVQTSIRTPQNPPPTTKRSTPQIVYYTTRSTTIQTSRRPVVTRTSTTRWSPVSLSTTSNSEYYISGSASSTRPPPPEFQHKIPVVWEPTGSVAAPITLPGTTTRKPTTGTRDDCGVPAPHPQMKVVGGKNSAFGAWPWQASVRRTSFFGFSSTHRCGGAIISVQWIATAGHCVDDLLLSQIRIRVGEYDFTSVMEPYPYIERGVKKKVVHPRYNFFTFENDLALVQLEEPLELLPHIKPICLPPDEIELLGRNATVTGWGRLSEGGVLPSVLQEVQMPIITNEKCKDMFLAAGRHEYIPDIFLCAGYEEGGRDSCQGDSGGPLQIQADDGHWFLAGIISWGIGCAEPNMPGVCTRISKFKDWILQNIT